MKIPITKAISSRECAASPVWALTDIPNGTPIYVFEQVPGNIRRVVAGERVGTIITKEGGR